MMVGRAAIAIWEAVSTTHPVLYVVQRRLFPLQFLRYTLVLGCFSIDILCGGLLFRNGGVAFCALSGKHVEKGKTRGIIDSDKGRTRI